MVSIWGEMLFCLDLSLFGHHDCLIVGHAYMFILEVPYSSEKLPWQLVDLTVCRWLNFDLFAIGYAVGKINQSCFSSGR